MNLIRKKGIVLVIVLGLVLLFVITAASFMLISSSEIKMVRRQNDSTRAFYTAEAGLQDAICRLNTDFASYKDITATVTIPTGFIGGSYYTADITPPAYQAGTDTYLVNITAKGTGTNLSRKIQQTVEMGETWVFGDYMLYFGGTSDMETYTFDIGKDASIIGDIFANGDLSVGKDFYIDGDVLASGSITLDKDSVVIGECYPNSEPPGPPPVLDTTPYDSEITTAGGAVEGDQDIPSGLITGTTYVNGTATITADISVAEGDTATIVATGGITINAGQAVGDNIVLITDGTLLAEKNYSVGSNCMLYSSSLVDFSKEADAVGGNSFGVSGSGSVIITPGSVKIAKSFGDELGFYGFIFADGEVDIAKACTVTGVIAGNGTLDMAKDATLVHERYVVDFDSIPGLSGSVWLVRSTEDWEEVVPAD